MHTTMHCGATVLHLAYNYAIFSAMTARAYAKINLGLRILNKREDGYHNLETVFHRINIFDTITFEQFPSVELICGQTTVPTDETNLCVKAALKLQQKHGIREGVRMILQKNIPVGAGLGGGSADAASTLLSLVKLWNIAPVKNELEQIALSLGSDVPYFLGNGSAYATGRGEQLGYFDLDIPYWIVTAYPGIHISTAWAYQNLKITVNDSSRSLKSIIQQYIQTPALLKNVVRNDFEPLVLEAHPSIARLKEDFYTEGAEFSQLSGSGSAVYALFKNENDVRNIVDKIKNRYSVSVTPPNFQADYSS